MRRTYVPADGKGLGESSRAAGVVAIGEYSDRDGTGRRFIGRAARVVADSPTDSTGHGFIGLAVFAMKVSLHVFTRKTQTSQEYQLLLQEV